jgi:uncharacterized membrane protein YbhN (UPF0104 family)
VKSLKIPSWLKTLLFASIGVSLLYFAFKGVDLKAVGKEMGSAKLEWIGLSMLVGLAAVVSRGMRWKLVLSLRCLGLPCPALPTHHRCPGAVAGRC